MQPLLALIEEKDAGPAGDPIAKIIELLTTIVTTQQRQDADLGLFIGRMVVGFPARSQRGRTNPKRTIYR
jgi:hypothetical protein